MSDIFFKDEKIVNEAAQCTEFISNFLSKLQFRDDIKCFAIWFTLFMGYSDERSFDEIFENAREIYDATRKAKKILDERESKNG